MKITKAVKEHIKKQPKKVKELPNEFINTMACYCINEDVHLNTIYKICTVKGMDQMLTTMYEEVVEKYQLHRPTIEKIKDKSVRDGLNRKMEPLKLRLPLL